MFYLNNFRCGTGIVRFVGPFLAHFSARESRMHASRRVLGWKPDGFKYKPNHVLVHNVDVHHDSLCNNVWIQWSHPVHKIVFLNFKIIITQTVPKRILEGEMFLCIWRNVYCVFWKCFTNWNFLNGVVQIIVIAITPAFKIFSLLFFSVVDIFHLVPIVEG